MAPASKDEDVYDRSATSPSSWPLYTSCGQPSSQPPIVEFNQNIDAPHQVLVRYHDPIHRMSEHMVP